MELQGRYDEITKRGLGLIAISYDSVETLKKFADSRGITFPLVSDPGSVTIKRYGLFNDTVDPKTPAYGVPYPGTFLIDRQGVVTSRYFEDAYQERNTAASILVREGLTTDAAAVSASTAHLGLTASVSDSRVAPGERVSITLDVTPARGIHVYAPGPHGYQVARLSIDPQPWLRVHPTTYPPSEVYFFAPLNERVAVYAKPFRLVTDVTILATQEIQKTLAGMESVTVSGALEYQACDDKVCFNPSRVPISFTLGLKALDRKPPG